MLQAGGGTGDITSVVTASNSGIQGGANTGDVTLSLDFNSLTSLTAANLDFLDLFVIRDQSSNANPYRTISKGILVEALITGNTLEATSGRIRVPTGGIDTLQLSDDAVTEPKLAMGNAPSNDQVISWDGSALQWVDQAAGGGTGDITGIVTEVAGGLQGGALSGEVTLALNLGGLGTVGASSFQSADEILFYDTGVTNTPNRMIRKDQFVVALVDGTTLDTSGGDIQIADEGVTEGKMDISNAPTSGYVLGWNGTDMVWRAEGTPQTTHDLWAAWSLDATFTESEVLAGSSSDTDEVIVPNATGGLYLGIWRSDADGGAPTEVHIAGGGNQRNGMGCSRSFDGKCGARTNDCIHFAPECRLTFL